jgi:hypothetical protein
VLPGGEGMLFDRTAVYQYDSDAKLILPRARLPRGEAIAGFGAWATISPCSRTAPCISTTVATWTAAMACCRRASACHCRVAPPTWSAST